jgi:hypothetical protein
MAPAKRSTRPRKAATPKAAPKPVPREVELAPDKTVVWRLAGVEYVLREPTWGDLRELGKRHEKGTADVRKRTAEVLAEMPDEPAARTATNLRLLAEVMEQGEQAVIDWWQIVFELLETEGRKLPIDDAPSWIVDPTVPGQVLNHWKTAPPLLGAR